MPGLIPALPNRFLSFSPGIKLFSHTQFTYYMTDQNTWGEMKYIMLLKKKKTHIWPLTILQERKNPSDSWSTQHLWHLLPKHFFFSFISLASYTCQCWSPITSPALFMTRLCNCYSLGLMPQSDSLVLAESLLLFKNQKSHHLWSLFRHSHIEDEALVIRSAPLASFTYCA